MLYKLTSDVSNLFSDAFFDGSTGLVDIEIVSASANTVVVNNPFSGITTTMSGSNFAFTAEGRPTSGTVTSMTMANGATAIGEITGISWNLVTLDSGLLASETDDYGLLLTLFNLQPITIDLRMATGDIDFEDVVQPFAEGITQPVTVYGGPFVDDLMGGSGNDTTFFAGNDPTLFLFDVYEATQGNDTLNFTGVTDRSFAFLDYDQDYGPIDPLTFNINGSTNTGTISTNAFTDTLVDVAAILEADGLGLGGSAQSDTYNLTLTDGQWASIQGAEGNEDINITFVDGGTVRLDYRFGQNDDPSGVNVNLSTGIVDDGLGTTDTLSISGPGEIEVRGSFGDDTLVGSSGDDRFISERGNDSVDGGDGYDILNYDRSDVSSMVIDLGAGTASGSWDGFAFTDTFTNIERVRGSREGDTIYGSDGADSLFGEEGDDVLYDGRGNDNVYGWEGDDTVYLTGGDSFDYIDLHTGDDLIELENHEGGYVLVNHWDLSYDNAFTVVINGLTDNTVIDKGAGNGSTVINRIDVAMLNDSGRIHGSSLDDTFTVAVVEDGGIDVRGGRGDDTYNLLESDGRLFIDLYESVRFEAATDAAQINLTTGVIANDGFGFTDTITGVGNLSILVGGTHLADSFTGSDGDDGFYLAGGNDVADGLDGFDTLGVDGRDASARSVINLATGTATGENNGVAYSATVTGFEAVRGTDFGDIVVGDGNGNELNGRSGDDFLFGDGIQVASVISTANQVFRLYEATLGREPDSGGHAGWTELLLTGQRELSEVAAGFVNSGEFQNVYGSLSDPLFVEQLYQNVLKRSASEAEVDAWLDVMAGGSSRADIVIGFSEALEFRNNTAEASNAFANERTAAEWSDEIYRLYQATLAREPDVASFKGWADALSGGTALAAAAGGFVNSLEFQNVYGALSDSDFIGLLYQNVLGRTASQAEIDGWLDVMAGGSTRPDVVLGFSQSLEFRNSTADDLVDWVRSQGEDDILIGEDGNNHLMGGMMSDTFVFRPNANGESMVYDFEAWDGIALQDFSFATRADAVAAFTQAGADVVFDVDGTEIRLLNTDLSLLTEENVYI